MLGFPSYQPPEMPSNCVTRAGTHLRMVQLGLSDMESADHDRVTLGYYTVAIFGRSVSLALQHLKTWDKPAFLSWYAPWAGEMRRDPLCRFFYNLRTDIIHDVIPMAGVVLGAFGPGAPQVGTIHIPEDNIPREHRGKPIEDPSALNLCRLYLAYLQEMFDSFLTIVWEIDDRAQAAHYSQLGPGNLGEASTGDLLQSSTEGELGVDEPSQDPPRKQQ